MTSVGGIGAFFLFALALPQVLFHLNIADEIDIVRGMARFDSSGTMIWAREISKSFDNVHAVDGLSFDVRRDEVFGLLGPNGAGKTTTIKQILGLLGIDAGEVSVLGLDPTKDAVGIMPEDKIFACKKNWSHHYEHWQLCGL